MSGTWGSMRWLIVNADAPDEVHHERAMLGIPTGADYLIGAIKLARRIATPRRGHTLTLTPEMYAFEAAKDGLELALKREPVSTDGREH